MSKASMATAAINDSPASRHGHSTITIPTATTTIANPIIVAEPSLSKSHVKLSATSKDLLAGTFAGVASVLLVYPLDTIRVRLQTTDKARFSGIRDVVTQTIRKEGARGFYKGLSTPLAAQGLQKATMFVSFGTAQRILKKHAATSHPLLHTFISGASAGVANALVATPIELIRGRLQVQYHRHIQEAKYKGPIDCARQIINSQGIRGLWTGLLPMIYRDSIGVGMWYTTFEYTRQALVSSHSTTTSPTSGAKATPPPKWKIMLAGACAGVAFWAFAFPQDLIKSVIQTRTLAISLESYNKAIAPSFFSVGKELVVKEGIGRLWRGFSVAVIRGIPGAAIAFTAYTTAMEFMNEQGL